MSRDYYDVLGVQRDASKDEIKQAFRRLARQYHPDVSEATDAEDRFKEINEAYQVLSDDRLRAAYDRYGPAGVNNATGGFSGGMPGFEDIFEEIFGNFGFGGFGGFGGRRRRATRGRDLRHDLTLDFEEAIFGTEVEIELTRQETCETCQGRRAAPGSKTSTCPECHGRGQVRRVQQAFGFSVVNVVTCPRCNGTGEIIETPCPTCRGTGIQRKTRTLSVKIPPGVDDGMQVRLGGEGEPSANGGLHGDLYVVIHVRPHEFFKRRDHDIILELSINVAQAALGDVIEVPTVDGPVELTVPPGTQSGKVIRLRGHGVPKLRRDGSTGGRGDQLVVLNVEVPTKLTREQRDLFEQLAQTLGRKVTPQKVGRGFVDRISDFFGGGA